MLGKGIHKSVLAVVSLLALSLVLAMPAVAAAADDGAQDSSADIVMELFIEAVGAEGITNTIEECPENPEPERSCQVDPNG